jgi:hypothetical protein
MFSLNNNSEFNKYLHTLSKYKHLEIRIEDILLFKYKIDHYNKKNLIPNVELRDFFESVVVYIGKVFFKMDDQLNYELKELAKKNFLYFYSFS